MDINKLKETPKFKVLQRKVIDLLHHQDELEEKIFGVTRLKIQEETQKFTTQFSQYFSSNGFKLTIKGEDVFKASNENFDVILYLRDITSIRVDFNFNIKNLKINDEITIKPSEKFDNLLHWKNNLRELKYNHFEISSRDEAVLKMKDNSDLESLVKGLNENIENYENLVEIIDDIQFVYISSIVREDFESFADYFEKIPE